MIAVDIADIAAEEAEVGIVVETVAGMRLALDQGVTADLFVSPPCAAVFTAATARDVQETLEERIVAIALAATVDVEWLRERVEAPRRTYRDRDGQYARRLHASAERVARFRAAVDELADLGIVAA